MKPFSEIIPAVGDTVYMSPGIIDQSSYAFWELNRDAANKATRAKARRVADSLHKRIKAEPLTVVRVSVSGAAWLVLRDIHGKELSLMAIFIDSRPWSCASSY